MGISDIKINQGKLFISGRLESIKRRRIESLNSDVLDVVIYDQTGKIEIGVFKNMDKIDQLNLKKDTEVRIENGLCKGEFGGMKKVTIGIYGKIHFKINGQWTPM